jgi:polyhydroxybutyrate depolymerase
MKKTSRRSLLIVGATVLIGAGAAQTAHACGIDTPCEIEDRAYYIAMPEDQSGLTPAVVYLHGAGGSGAGALRNSGMVDAYLERGYAVIAPDGSQRASRDGRPRNGRGWGFHPTSGGQMAEIEYLQNVRADATEMFDLDPDNIILAGFSIGGSMAAYTACLAPNSFAAYAPLGGNFWRPHPTECEAPVRMLHTHGWTDGTVPLEGRVLNRVPTTDPTARMQGDVFRALEIWRETNECYHLKADSFVTTGPFWRRAWERCADGSALELALFPRGHIVPEGWSDLVIDWYEGL